MTEYEMKIREAANDIKYMRSASGAMYGQMIFSLISLLVSKKKISKTDLEIILEAERISIKNSVKSYVESTYGQENSAINRSQDLKEVEKLCLEYVEEIKNVIIELSGELSPNKKTNSKKRKKKKLRVEEAVPKRKKKIVAKADTELEIIESDEESVKEKM